MTTVNPSRTHNRNLFPEHMVLPESRFWAKGEFSLKMLAPDPKSHSLQAQVHENSRYADSHELQVGKVISLEPVPAHDDLWHALKGPHILMLNFNIKGDRVLRVKKADDHV